MTASHPHMAVIEAPEPTAEVVVTVELLAMTVPDTPPHLKEKMMVGVAVVP